MERNFPAVIYKYLVYNAKKKSASTNIHSTNVTALTCLFVAISRQKHGSGGELDGVFSGLNCCLLEVGGQHHSAAQQRRSHSANRLCQKQVQLLFSTKWWERLLCMRLELMWTKHGRDMSALKLAVFRPRVNYSKVIQPSLRFPSSDAHKICIFHIKKTLFPPPDGPVAIAHEASSSRKRSCWWSLFARTPPVTNIGLLTAHRWHGVYVELTDLSVSG